MPLKGQNAGKIGHEEILQNPDIEAFLQDYKNVPRPTPAALSQIFGGCPKISQFTGVVPDVILALDGSLFEASADDREPSRKVGYIKVGMIGLDMQRYAALAPDGSRFVDPMAVARLQESSALSMALPGAYLKKSGHKTVVEGYRFAIQKYFESDATKIGKRGKASLLDTLIVLLRYNDSVKEIDGKDFVIIGACPTDNCQTENIPVSVETHIGNCSGCGSPVLITDALRVHECFVESGTNQQTYNRLMLASEHLVAAHQIIHYKNTQLEFLERLAVCMDGPLSINGEPAKFHKALLKLLYEVNDDLVKQGFGPMVVMGLTKTGIAVDHFSLIADQIPKDIAFAITDDYRGLYMTQKDYARPFGDDTYYGQDVLVKTARGRQFVICLPYPCASKSDAAFSDRFDLTKYPAIGKSLAIINLLESDLYENSMIPVILAHEYASISLAPGGKVLDLATARALNP